MRAARQRSPNRKGGSLPPGKRGKICAPGTTGAMYFDVLIWKVTVVGPVELTVGVTLLKLEEISDRGGVDFRRIRSTFWLFNPNSGLMLIL
jgi:hypothetical protein